MAAYSCQSKCPKEHGGNLIVFVHLASEVPYCHCFICQKTHNPAQFQGRGHRPQPSVGGVLEYFQSSLKLLQVSQLQEGSLHLAHFLGFRFLGLLQKFCSSHSNCSDFVKDFFPSQRSLILFGVIDVYGTLVKPMNPSKDVKCIK